MSHTIETPVLGRRYFARTLPPGSVVRSAGASSDEHDYVIGRGRLCMKWEQPIPGSDEWLVVYVGRLEPGVWMTPRERAEVDEVRRRRESSSRQGTPVPEDPRTQPTTGV